MDSKAAQESVQYSTIVLVTDQVRCERLIQAGRRLADKTGTRLYVVNVNKMDIAGRQTDIGALDYLFHISKKNNAVMNIFYGVDVTDVLKQAVTDYNAVNVVTGRPCNEESVLSELWNAVEDVHFHVVNAKGEIASTQDSVKV